jgi:hypothetical protein
VSDDSSEVTAMFVAAVVGGFGELGPVETTSSDDVERAPGWEDGSDGTAASFVAISLNVTFPIKSNERVYGRPGACTKKLFYGHNKLRSVVGQSFTSNLV